MSWRSSPRTGTSGSSAAKSTRSPTGTRPEKQLLFASPRVRGRTLPADPPVKRMVERAKVQGNSRGLRSAATDRVTWPVRPPYHLGYALRWPGREPAGPRHRTVVHRMQDARVVSQGTLSTGLHRRMCLE